MPTTTPDLKALEAELPKASSRRRRRRRAPPPIAPKPPAPPSADGMLARANRLRARKAFAAAADAYAEVRRFHPNTGPAYVAAVAEGQLVLKAQSDPTRALSAFSAALRMRSDGPLDAEARFGRAAALSALGRTVDARRAWRALIRKYPNSAPAKRAERRLKAGP